MSEEMRPYLCDCKARRLFTDGRRATSVYVRRKAHKNATEGGGEVATWAPCAVSYECLVLTHHIIWRDSGGKWRRRDWCAFLAERSDTDILGELAERAAASSIPSCKAMLRFFDYSESA